MRVHRLALNIVFERDSEHDFFHRPRDWGILLHWGAEYLERVLPTHLKARLKEIRCDPHLDNSVDIGPVPYVNAITGDVMAEMPMPGTNRISRMKLRRFLTRGQDLDIKFGKRVESLNIVDDVVSATFQDGTTASGHMAIGCDGSPSKVREFLVGDEAARLTPVDLTMINFPMAGYTAEEALLLQTIHPVFKIATHPDKPGNALLADPTTWKFQNYVGWWGPPYAEDLQDPETRMAFYRSWVSSTCEPFRTAGLKLAEGEVVPVYRGQQWAPTIAWDNHKGRVTLAGDAAHSMLPQRGQGLNNAVKDASDIVDAIKAGLAGDTTLDAAITAYEAEMKPRGATEVAVSLEQALKSRDKDTIMDSPVFRMGFGRHETATATGDSVAVTGMGEAMELA